ncbi:MAG: hypothetical protein KF802_15785 [Bdellovibrionaceae bacterium]|nr:hypothetical protein [Pseudobdellovibrionaceae bacterium]
MSGGDDISGTAHSFSSFASSNLSSQSACTTTTASLHPLAADGAIGESALMTTPVESDGHFIFRQVNEVGIDVNDPRIKYVIRVSGCGTENLRPLTGATQQDVTLASTLVTFSAQVSQAGKKTLPEMDRASMIAAISRIDAVAAADLTDLLDQVIADPALNTLYRDLTAVDPVKLQEIPPEITLTTPSPLEENTANNYAVTLKHWNHNYVPAFEWVANSSTVSTTSTWVFSTTANSQGRYNVTLKVGSKTGSVIDPAKPVVSRAFQVLVNNTVPAVAPALSISGTGKVKNRAITVNIHTGTGMSACGTFSTMALTENALVAPLIASDYNLTCTQAGLQSLTHTLTAGDGSRVVALWVRDAAGNISSVPATASVILDETNPSLGFGTLATILKGGAGFDIPYTASDATSGLATLKLQYSEEGGAYADVADLMGASSPHAWSVPSYDVAVGKFKLIATDEAGNTASLESGAFTVDATPPTVTIVSPAAGTRAQSGVTVAGACETGLNVTLGGSGADAPVTVACASSAYSQALTFTGGDGAKNITVSQTDAAGNTTTVNRNFYRDTTPPNLSFTGPLAGTSAKNGVLITGVCESGQNVDISGTGAAAPVPAACTAGVFSASLVFSAGDGAKNIVITQSDSAGNTATANRDFVRDSNAASLAVTTPEDGDEVPATFSVSGICDDAGGSISITGADVNSSPQTATCASGTFARAITLSGADGAKSFVVEQTDAASVTTTLTLNVTKDTDAPALTIASPMANTRAQNGVTLSGVCETGLPVEFSGAGLSNAGAVVCAANAYSFNAVFTANDETKNIVATQTDAAGNATSVDRDFIKDTSPPVLAVSSPSAGAIVPATVSVSGTCENGGGDVSVSSTAIAAPQTTGCTAGAFAFSLALTGADGTKTLTFTQTDSAGNGGTLNLNLTLDKTPPVLTKSSPADGAAVQSTVTLTGTCEAGRSVVAGGTGLVSGESDLCVAGSYSVDVVLTSGEGSKAVTLTETDGVGNTATLSFTLLRDNTAPILTQTAQSSPKYSNTSSLAYGGACETGLSVVISGDQNASVPCSAGAWTWSANKTTDATYNYTFTQTDGAGNSAATSAVWIRDTESPALTWTSPATGTAALTQITATGACETGLNIAITGAGLVGATSQMCAGGSYSQVLYFSASDGAKPITISQTDLAGNLTTLTKTFYRDETPPAITQTTITSNPKYSNGNNITFGGSCETGLPITVIRNASVTESTSVPCTASAWSYTVATQTSDGAYTYSFKQTDSVGNSASTSSQWIRDVVPPSMSITSAVTLVTANNAETFSGTCATGSSNNNALVVKEKNNAGTLITTGSATCSVGGTFSYTTTTQTTDMARSYEFTQSDKAGNSTTLTGVWERNASVPNLSIDNISPAINQDGSIVLEGNCDSAYGIEIKVNGVVDQSAFTCSSGRYTYPYANGSDGQYVITLKQQASLQSITRSFTWIRDTGKPTLAAGQFKINNDTSPARKSRVSIDLSASDSLTRITDFCLMTKRQVDAAPANPAATAPCWISVESAGQTASTTLNLSAYGYNLPLVPDDYRLFVWVMDEAANVSSLSNGGNGTLNRDMEEITYTVPQTPVVNKLLVTKRDDPAQPPTAADLTISSGAPVFIKWQITDDNLASGGVKLEFTTDDTNYSTITGSLSDASTNGTACTINNPATAADDTMTGCYRWASAPTAGYYRIRLSARDNDGLTGGTTSTAINVADKINFLAGNTDEGNNLSATGAVFFPYQVASEVQTSPGQLAVTRDNVVFVVDKSLGLLTINPEDGLKKVFLKYAGTDPSGNGGPVSSATARFIVKIALDFSYPKQKLWVFDYNQIRRIDLETNTIENVIGPGSATADTVANPKTLKVTYSADDYWVSLGSFTPLPNGNLLFSNRADFAAGGTMSTWKLRTWNASDNSVTTMKLTSLTNSSGYTGVDMMGCFQRESTGVQFDTDGNILARMLIFTAVNSVATCNIPAAAGFQYTLIDAAGKSLSTAPPVISASDYARFTTGMDGMIYMVRRIGVWRYEGVAANTWTRIYGSGLDNQQFCADDQTADACSSRIDSLFVDESGQAYISEWGAIRIVTPQKTIKTIYGQPLVSPSGTPALSARLGSNLASISMRGTGVYAFTDDFSRTLREFNVGGNVHLIAGNSLSGIATNNIDSTTTPFEGNSIVVDPGTGDVFNYAGGYRISRLVRDTSAIGSVGKWQTWIGGGSTVPSSADGLSSISFNTGCNTIGYDSLTQKTATCGYPKPLAIGNNRLLVSHHYNSTEISSNDPLYRGVVLKAYRLIDKIQEPLASSAGPNKIVNNVCALGTSTNTCRFASAVGMNLPQAFYSDSKSSWLAALYNKNVLYRLKYDSNVEGVTFDDNATAVAYREDANQKAVYYCAAATNTLRKVVLDNDLNRVSDTALSWPIPSISCQKYSMQWDAARNSVVFIYKQNGLMGIAEYLDP